MTQTKQFVEVAVLLPIRKTFVYEVPEEMRPAALPGKRVWVPFGRRFLAGFILGPAQMLPPRKTIMAIRKVLDDDSALPEKLLTFFIWASRYYFQPVGEVIKTALPAGLRLRQRETLAITDKGLKLLASFSPASPESKILLALKGRREKVLSSSLLEKLAGPGREFIGQMIADGLIKKNEDSFEQHTKEKKKSFIRFLNQAEDLPLSSREKEALDFIQKAGELPLGDFKKIYKNSSAFLAVFKEKQFIEIIDKEEFRKLSWDEIEDWVDGPPSLLTEGQKESVAEIGQALHSKKFYPFLLHGVTGSGKTEVYLRAIAEAVAQERQALLLVPEIVLTAQLVAYFRSRIDYPMAVLHSGLSSGERYDEWRKIKRGLVKLVIGARSAIFAPLERLGIIIVDEEHDPSYKQEDKVRYNARDLALVRGKMENAVVVLGSATPSMESYHNALENKFRCLTLPHRIDHRPLPEIQVVDMRMEKAEGRERTIFSRALEEALKQNAERGEQALLFLNRRGFSTFTLCRDCGFVYKCPNCSVSLIYHLPHKSFQCHYCSFSLPALSHCPECASINLMLFGLGTQRLEEEIKKKLPQVQVARMDRDTTARKKSHQKILNQVRRGEVNLLVGTQMITKGHDLPRVTLVGVLAADLSLNVPDFRASERTFQLLTQVAGRAGRRSSPGRVIVQTYNPHQYSIQMAKSQDFPAFYKEEAKFRKEMGYPPFTRLINLRLEGNSQARVLHFAKALAQSFLNLLQKEKKFQGQFEMLGPTMNPLARLKGKYRYQILLKGEKWSTLHAFTEKILEKADQEIAQPGVKLIVDVDPVNML
ncbi:MAG: primosomal protein N' [Deltaproteobacteria bacterium]|nr:primosomal protein N' [Deltaproteobacteria bacterium]